MERAIKELRYLRKSIIEEHSIVVKLVIKSISRRVVDVKDGKVISERKLTKDEIDSYLLEADEGNVNVDFIIENIPVKIGALEKIVGITKAIQEIKKDINYLV